MKNVKIILMLAFLASIATGKVPEELPKEFKGFERDYSKSSPTGKMWATFLCLDYGELLMRTDDFFKNSEKAEINPETKKLEFKTKKGECEWEIKNKVYSESIDKCKIQFSQFEQVSNKKELFDSFKSLEKYESMFYQTIFMSLQREALFHLEKCR